MTMFVMTLGELNYHETFTPWENLSFSTLTNILFIVLVLGMPIIMMNMLVSSHNIMKTMVRLLHSLSITHVLGCLPYGLGGREDFRGRRSKGEQRGGFLSPFPLSPFRFSPHPLPQKLLQGRLHHDHNVTVVRLCL